MQVNQNVNATNFLLVSSQTGNSYSTQTDTSSSMDFASVLQNTNHNYQEQNDQNVAKTTANVDVSSNDEHMNAGKSSTEEKNKSVDTSYAEERPKKETAVADTKNSKDIESENVDSISESDAVEEDAELSQMVQIPEGLEHLSNEDVIVLLETISNLLQDIMQQFDICFEELSVKLKEFEIEPSDLLTQEGLKDFYLQMEGVERSELIINEELNVQLQEFMAEVSEELNLIQSMLPEDEVLVESNDLKQVLSELILDYKETDEIVPDFTSMKDVEIREPEDMDTSDGIVISVKNHTSDVTSNPDYQNDDTHEQTDSQQYTVSEEVVTEEKTFEPKQNSFENPILQAIQNAVNNVEDVVLQERTVQQNDIVRQMVEQVRLNMNQQTTSLELQLYPEHLGRIQIHVVSKEGIMTASIVAETEAAKQAIESGLLNLKEAMEQQELKVEAIEVMVSTMGFEKGEDQQGSYENEQTSHTGRRLNLSDLGDDVSDEDEAEMEKMIATGSSVSYRA